jgi:hypothetical protein
MTLKRPTDASGQLSTKSWELHLTTKEPTPKLNGSALFHRWRAFDSLKVEAPVGGDPLVVLTPHLPADR